MARQPREPLDLMTAKDRARARRRILGGPDGARKREELAAALDDTRSWVDPNGYRLSDRLWNARAYDRQQIDGLLRQSIAAGHDPIQTARRLSQFLTPVGAQQVTRTPRGGAGLYAARRLARTETTRAFGQATIEAAKRTRFVTLIRWRTSDRYSAVIDNGVCQDNVGEYAPDEVPQYPAHPQCRCTLLPVAQDPEAVVDQLLRELDAPESSAPGTQPGDTAMDGLVGGRVDPLNPPPSILAREAVIRLQRFESAAAFDDAGAETMFQDGAARSVTFDEDVVAGFKDQHLTHNHPSGWDYPTDDPRHIGNSFSGQDLQLAVYADMASIRAVSPIADYTMVRPVGGWGTTDGYIFDEHHRLSMEVRAENMQLVRSGQLTYKDAEAHHNHQVAERLANQLGWIYERRIKT